MMILKAPRRWSATFSLMLIGVAVAGCSSTNTSSRSEERPADEELLGSLATGPPTRITSKRLGYEVNLPPGWSLTSEASSEWRIPTAPKGNSAYFDTIEFDAGDPFFVVGRQRLSRGTTLESWVTRLETTDTITYPAYCEASDVIARSGDLDGEPASTFARRCPTLSPDTVIAQIAAIHGRHGYLVTCHSDEAAAGDPELLLTACERWLSGFTFAG